MKNIKTCGLIVMAAAAIAVLTGVGSASATVLCKSNPAGSECPAASRFSNPTVLNAHSSDWTVLLDVASGSKMTCDSDMEIVTDGDKGSNPLVGQVTKLSTSNCKGTYCLPPEQPLSLPYSTELKASGSGNGTLSVKGGKNGNPAFKFTGCIPPGYFGVCTWTAPEIKFTVNGGIPTTLVASNATLERQAGGATGCAKTVTLNATYRVGDVNENNLQATSTISGTSYFGPVETTCASTLKGSNLLQSSGSISSLTFSGCKGDCKTASALNLSYATHFTPTEGSNGTLEVSGSGGVPTFKHTFCAIVLGLDQECFYEAKGLTLDVNGGFIKANNETLTNSTTKGSGLCPETVKWNASYGALYSPVFWVFEK